jgi:hypothetical protein
VLQSRNEFITVTSDVAHDVCDKIRGLEGPVRSNAAIRLLAPFSRVTAGNSPPIIQTIASDAPGESTIELVDQAGRRQVYRHRVTEAVQVR